MEEIYVNVEQIKPVHQTSATNNRGSISSKKRLHLGVLISLGLLNVFLLAGLVVFGVHSRGLAADLQTCSDKLSSMTEERDLLNANLTELNKQLIELQSLSKQTRGLAAHLSTIRDNLTEPLQTCSDKLSSITEERDLLNANLTELNKQLIELQKKTCPAGWRMFSCSCYFVSTKSASWDEGREDCRTRGADLMVVDDEEQVFISTFNKKDFWIGLTDKETEGSWKWVDGSPFNRTYWKTDQPDNGGGHSECGEEDCVHATDDGGLWNDLSCTSSRQWICEKSLKYKK